MADHPNVDLLRRGYEAYSSGDMDTINQLFADDIVWHVPGRSAIGGDYRGPEEVLAFFGKLQERTGGTFALELHDVLAGDDHVVVLARTTAERNGERRTFDVAHVWHVRDGKATEFWALSTDQYAGDEFLG